MDLPTRDHLARHFDRAREVVLAATGRWTTLHALRADPGERYPRSWQVDLRSFGNASTGQVFLVAALSKREVIGVSFASGDEIAEQDQWGELTVAGTLNEVSRRFAGWLLPYGFAFRGRNLDGCQPFIVEFTVGEDGALGITELGPTSMPSRVLRSVGRKERPHRRTAWSDHG